jgi:NADPH:quinone reductase-like Zn-dependent oxidoreductase
MKILSRYRINERTCFLMKAAIINKYGKPSVLHIGEVDEVHPKIDEVKIKVHATSVNPVDFKTRSGMIFFMSGFKFPKVLGSDFAGVIIECGEGVKDYAPGDEVYGFTNAVTKGGAYGEFLCVNTSIITRKPAGLNFVEAGVIPLAASTAYQGLFHKGKMTSGMHVCITGATGGVGHLAVQIAKAANCHVTGICHSRNEELALQLGCDEVLPYNQVDFKKGNRRFDLIFDAVGKYGLGTFKSLLKNDGIYVSTIPSLSTMNIPLLSSIYKQKGCYFWANSNTSDLNSISLLMEQGALKPFIENTFTIREVAKAHALSETQKVRGKIGIEVNF